MLFWIAVALLAAAVTYGVARPLLGGVGASEASRVGDIAIYRDQLAEIEADLARGALTEAAAAEARSEVSRRLLRAAQSQLPIATSDEIGAVEQASQSHATSAAPSDAVASDQPPSTPPPDVPLHVFISLAIPLASLALYLTFGRPDLPAQPLSARLAEPVREASGQDLVAKVEAALRANPADGRGWDVIAPVYVAQGRFREAAEAYAAALRLLGVSPPRLVGFAKARIRIEDGVVPDDALKALQQTVAMDATLREPRFWLAVAKEQDGDRTGAAEDYRWMLQDPPEGAPWIETVRQRLSALEAADASPQAAAGSSLSNKASDRPELAKMSDVQMAQINAMVTRLAERLKANPDDPEGWKKLIRSYYILGRTPQAKEALQAARAAATNNAERAADLDALARELNLNTS